MAMSVGSTVSVAGLVFFGTITSLAAKIGKHVCFSRVLRPDLDLDTENTLKHTWVLFIIQ